MQVALIIDGSLAAKTGGTIYDRQIAEGLRALGWTVDVFALDGLALLPDGALALIDGLAYASGAEPIERHAARLRLVALVHLPLACEIGLDAGDAARRRAIERRVLSAVKQVIVTGRRPIEWLERQGIDRGRIAVVQPGTFSPMVPVTTTGTSERQGPVQLLSVGALTPGKGHEALIRALVRMPAVAWSLRCAGSLTRHEGTAAAVRALIDDHRLGDRVILLDEIDEPQLRGEYGDADVFVLATWRETYGMAVAEAIAHGLPVVSTDTGAISEIVGPAGFIVAPGDEEALAGALTQVVTNPALRRELAAAARLQRTRLPTWAEAARGMAGILQAVADG